METASRSISLNKFEQRSLLALFTFGGFFPVCSIILHCLGFLPLHQCLFFLVAPILFLFTFFGIKFPAIGKIVVHGFIAGIVAVFFYDLSRVPYILCGWLDFIPKIGGWVTNTEEKNALLGYAWRYIGNGGGMGIAFFMLVSLLRSKKSIVLIGFLYGLFIFSGLMVVLLLFEHTQDLMFKVTPVSFTGSLTGHIIYGSSLGLIARKYF